MYANSYTADCLDFTMSLTGAADTRASGADNVTYSFYDEISVNLTTAYTCELLSETVMWRHVRLKKGVQFEALY